MHYANMDCVWSSLCLTSPITGGISARSKDLCGGDGQDSRYGGAGVRFWSYTRFTKVDTPVAGVACSRSRAWTDGVGYLGRHPVGTVGSGRDALVLLGRHQRKYKVHLFQLEQQATVSWEDAIVCFIPQ